MPDVSFFPEGAAMKRVFRILFPTCLLWATAASAQGPTIGPDNAQGYIGKEATVCGKIDSARYNENADGQPTFMHLGGAFPKHKFAIRVDGADRGKFDPAPENLVGKMVCVSGRVSRASGNRPEMSIDNPGVMQVL
jgi:hypothetical protein